MVRRGKEMKRNLVKRMSAIALSTLMAGTMMVGCGSSSSGTAGTLASGVSTDKEVTLKMYLIGDKPADFDEVYDKVNSIMKEEINATLQVNFIPWSDLATIRAIIQDNLFDPYDPEICRHYP